MCSPSDSTYQGNAHRKLTFARLATYVLNVERSLKKSAKTCREEDLLEAAETGNLAKLRWLLESSKDLNTEYTDQLGRTPLHLAVVNEHKEVVRFLLDHVSRQSFYKALLAAINIGNEEIAELIIEHPKYLEIKQESQARGNDSSIHDDQFFEEEVTPLILATQQNRFEVVMALLLKQERIEKPHRCKCSCESCFKQTTKDELKFARSRLNAYRGMASESYISLSSEDPILTSFKLRKELQQVAVDEKYYAAEYLALACQLSEYAVKLLDKVHGNEELNTILNSRTNLNEVEETFLQLPRLQLAIKYKEKKFVAHPSCQKKLTSLWFHYPNSSLMNRSNLLHTVIIFVVIIFFPFLSLVHIIFPNSKVSNFMRAPCIKFIFNAASYLLFLFLIIIQGYAEQNTLCRKRFFQHEPANSHLEFFSRNFSTTFRKEINSICLRNHQPVAMEMCILLWILGMLVNACQQIHRSGCKDHFMNVYNAMDFFMLSFYMASFTLKRITEQLIKSSLDFFSTRESWLKLLQKEQEALYMAYWLDADRFYWDSWDPTHVCEALFAIGNIVNFARLFHLLSINEHLGPMLISLERMIKDVMKFMVTFVPIFLAFMVGMYNLYWYYDPQVRKVVENTNHNIHTRAQDGFGNLELTFRTTFWALFGLKDARTVELGEGFKSRFTESVGYIVFGVYNWGAVIVLLNMLIAMMTRSFDKIATDQDIEWKFVRSRLYLDYINHGSSLPVPFNILLIPKFTFKHIQTWIVSCRKFIISKKRLGERDRTMAPLARPESSSRIFEKEIQVERSHFRSSFRVDECSPSSNQNNVVKSIVRRYIFDRLLASVAASDGGGTISSGLKQQLDSVKEVQKSCNRLSEQITRINLGCHRSPNFQRSKLQSSSKNKLLVNSRLVGTARTTEESLSKLQMSLSLDENVTSSSSGAREALKRISQGDETMIK
uniref:Putative transient receptor potential channel 4 n=1 Tax=Hirudo verbana TaxID=311461 RepID=A0A2S1WM38_9ANNE|nr:putative transient receptor potential channel 4 [Hirudo verbana]